jgi:hypothetical protein
MDEHTTTDFARRTMGDATKPLWMIFNVNKCVIGFREKLIAQTPNAFFVPLCDVLELGIRVRMEPYPHDRCFKAF